MTIISEDTGISSSVDDQMINERAIELYHCILLRLYLLRQTFHAYEAQRGIANLPTFS
ncbi:hypothetical protein KSD_73450 [Ktedonobacter sp. SOSP1-85]|nr:hypothetical protein KSD_73450 [Ktedonobacter sp. SOSP1-85]